MKRYGNIINESKVTGEFCRISILEAANGKSDRSDVRTVLENIERYSNHLRLMILNNDFVLHDYRYEVRIERGKERNICKPVFWPDQCIHHVLINSIRSILLARVDPYAVASIPNRGHIY